MARGNINQRLNGLNPLAYLGDNAYQPPEFIGESRAPTINDTNFELGTLWLNRTPNPPTAADIYMLVSLVQNRATWIDFAGAAASVSTLTGDTGGAVVPTSNNINVIAGLSTDNSGSTVSISGSGSTLTFNVTDSLLNTIIGKSSGNATLTGTHNTSLGYGSSTGLTSGGGNTVIGYLAGTGITTGSDNIIIGDVAGTNITTTSGNIILGTTASPGDSNTTRIGFGQTKYFGAGIRGVAPSVTDGQVVIIDSASQLGSISSSTANFVLTSNGVGAVPTFQAVSASGAVVSVTGGNNISITGTATNPIVNVSGTTNHAVQVGNATNSLTSITVGATNTVLLGNTGADPSFGSVPNAALANSSITLNNGTGISITGSPVSLGGSATINLSVPVAIANGGTNATSFATTDGTVYYDGTRLVTTATGTAGQVLTSNGAGVAPTYQAAGGSGATSFVTDSGTATPSAGVIDIKANNSTQQCGSSVLFSGATNVVQLKVTDASANTIIGLNAGNATLTATNSVGLGSLVLQALTTGIQNCIVGYGAANSLTVGGENTACGNTALQNLVSGAFNTSLGYGAGFAYSGSESSNICIGYATNGTAAESHTLRIGNSTSGVTDGGLTKSFIAGIRGITTDNNDAIAVLIDSAGQLGTVSSSKKLKANIRELGPESRPIYDLRPVSFNFKDRPKTERQVGLIAEEVAEVLPSLVARDQEGNPVSVKYHDLPVLLLNEIQRLELFVTELELRINELEARYYDHEDKLSALDDK